MLKRILFRLSWVILGLFLIVSLWIGAHHITVVANPKWTLDDLPKASDHNTHNGWIVLKNNLKKVKPTELEQEIMYQSWFRHTSSIEVIHNNFIKNQDVLEPLFQRIYTLQKKINIKPRFIGSSPIKIYDTANDLIVSEILQFWWIRYLSVLIDAYTNPHQAFETVKFMWLQAYDYTLNCQHTLACAIGENILSTTYDAAEFLSKVNTNQPEYMSLYKTIVNSDLNKLSMRNSIIAEYISLYDMLSSEPLHLFFDLAQTEKLARHRLEQLYSFTDGQTQTHPTFEWRSQNIQESLYNPKGKYLVDVITINLSKAIIRFHESIQELQKKQIKLRSAIKNNN